MRPNLKIYELGVYVSGPDSGYIDVVDLEDYRTLEREITAYQIAKDNLELALRSTEVNPAIALKECHEDFSHFQVY